MDKVNINRKWNFRFGENAGGENAADYSEYSTIGLPHSFGIPYLGEKDFYVGYGAYQKWLDIGADIDGKKYLLEFGAIFQVAEVYVNGNFIKKHEGGYTAFICDITDEIHYGVNNIFVRVNNMWNPVIAPRSGEHVFNGGIYRDVNLLIYNPEHIAWYGTFVKSKKIDEKNYEITIETETVACVGKILENDVLDAVGVVVAHSVAEVKSSITIQKLTIAAPVLWDIENPYLHRLVSRCSSDELITEFGIRDILWDTGRGFFLNGRRVLLDGANVHQDHGGWCDAITHTAIRRDIAMMKECGFNFIRGSHYPHHTEFARECDRQGMLFWSENVFWGIGGFGSDGYWNCSAMPMNTEHHSDFSASLKQTLSEMIRTNRNSPSVIAWSMGNEIFFSHKAVLGAAKELVAELVEYCHILDDTRLAGIGGVQRGGFDKIGDIAGYNGDGAVLFKNPTKPSIVAEYGSLPSFRPGKYDLYETKGSADYYPWRAGRAIWCGFHHGSIAEIGNLGIVDLYRLPLNAWYCIREKNKGIKPPQSAIDGKPHRIKLTADKTKISSDGTDDCMLTAQILDENGKKVKADITVTMEVISGYGLFPTGKKISFSKKNNNLYEGLCAIEMRSYYAGITKIKASAKDILSDELEIEVIGEMPADGEISDIIYPVAQTTVTSAMKHGVNIIGDRPVIVSSEKTAGSSMCLTSESFHSFWTPCKTDLDPNIILDMERVYEDFSINIERRNILPVKIKVFSSLDRENWTLISCSTSIIPFTKIKVKAEIKARYIKIKMQRGIKIAAIKIYEREPIVDLSL